MNRDNWLFGIFGVLLGFIAGYVMHEVLASRQPARLPAGGMAAVQEAAGGGGGAPSGVAAEPAEAPPAGAPAGGPSMEQIKQLREHVEKNPNDADAVLLLANLNYDIRNWQRAKELYEHYLTLKPETPDILTDFGVAVRELGDFKKALELFQRAEKMSPTHWQSRYNKVVVLAFDLKDYAAAKAAVAELQKLQPGNTSVQELAAEIQRRSAGGA